MRPPIQLSQRHRDSSRACGGPGIVREERTEAEFGPGTVADDRQFFAYQADLR